MEFLVIALAVLGGAAPIVGTARIYLRLRGERARRGQLAVERGHDGPVLGDLSRAIASSWNLSAAVADARNDLVLVGVGFALSALATVLGVLV